MGNSQSNTNIAQQQPAKPKSKTNSPSLTPKAAASPVSVCSKYADLGFSRVRQLKSQVSSPTKSGSGSRFLQDGDEALGELAAHLQMRLSSLSRSNSVASQKGPGSRKLGDLAASPKASALTTTQDAVDKDTAMKILKEVRKSASPADLAALRQALKPSSPVPIPKPNRLLTRTSDVHQSTSLTRRRSWMITPGVATRPRSQTDGQRTSRFSWRTSTMGPPGKLGSLPSMSLLEEEHCQTPRAQTPGDLDYSHLGSLKLGSLVVTNGTPSPAESIRKVSRRVSYSDLPYEEDYFTAFEGVASRKAREKAAHSRSKSSILPKTPPFPSAVRGANQPKMNKAKRGRQPAAKPTEQPESPQEYFKKALRVVNKSEDALSSLEEGVYDADTATTHHDEGYSDACLNASPGHRHEAYRILDGTMYSEPETTTGQTPLMPIPAKSPLREGQRGSNGRPTPSTFDSGYSSGGSFRNKEGYRPCAPPAGEAQPQPARSENSPDNTDKVSLYNFEQMMALSQKPLPPIPTKELVPNETGMLSENWESDVDMQLARLETPALDAVVEPAPNPASAQPAATSPSVYQWSWERTSSFSSRFQKRRRSLPEMPPVVQTSPVIDQGTIPSVPDPVRTKFVRRLSDAPEMECLTKTYPSKGHINAEEPTVDPPTMLSRHSSMTSCISLEPEFEQPRGRHHRRSHTERPLSWRVSRSLSLFRSRPGKKELAEGAVGTQKQGSAIDIRGVSMALGKAPSVVSPTRTPSVATSPNQATQPEARCSSVMNMDAMTAAGLARLRSQDRAARRPEMPQRPTSYYDFRPRGEVTGRPHSSYVDTAAQGSVVGSRGPSAGRDEAVSQSMERRDGSPKHVSSGHVESEDGVCRVACSQEQRLLSEDGLLDITTRSPTSVTTVDRHGGHLPASYPERRNNSSGSAETRELHRATSRRNMHLSNQLGRVNLSDVPVLLQRMS